MGVRTKPPSRPTLRDSSGRRPLRHDGCAVQTRHIWVKVAHAITWVSGKNVECAGRDVDIDQVLSCYDGHGERRLMCVYAPRQQPGS